MTLEELVAASEAAGNAVFEYRSIWNSWREEAKEQITEYRSNLAKETKRLLKMATALDVIEEQMLGVDKLLSKMAEPPVLPHSIRSKVMIEATGETVGVPPELRPIARALTMFIQPRGACGIYFLVRGATVVYVGQSVNIAARVGQHTDKPHDRVFYLEVARPYLNRVENAFISLLRPQYNATSIKEHTEKDQRIVEMLVADCLTQAASFKDLTESVAAKPPEDPQPPPPPEPSRAA